MKVLLDNNKNTSRKRKTNIIWKIVLSSFSIFHTKLLYMTKWYFLMWHYLYKKNTIQAGGRAGYAERSHGVPF